MVLLIAVAVFTIGTFVAIVCKVEIRLALHGGGLALAVVSLKPQAWSDALVAGRAVLAGAMTTTEKAEPLETVGV